MRVRPQKNWKRSHEFSSCHSAVKYGQARAQTTCRCCSPEPEAPQSRAAARLLLLPTLLAAPAAAAQEVASNYITPVDPSTYVPGPVEVGWQIWFGAAVGVFPFILGAYEFGKRILIQRRCENCDGIGLVKKGKYYKKCVECGGFFPWLGWKTFFTSTASPGNGGPLLQPRGQTGVLYKVPPARKAGDGQGAQAGSEGHTGSLTEAQKAVVGKDARDEGSAD